MYLPREEALLDKSIFCQAKQISGWSENGTGTITY